MRSVRARTWVLGGVVALALVALIVAAAAAGSHSANRTDVAGKAIPGFPMGLGSSPNQAVSRHDVRSLLSRLVLATGAVRLRDEPHGDHGYLKAGEALEADAARSLADEWWEVPGTPAGVMAFVSAHPPTLGAHGGVGSQVGMGTASNLRTGTSAESLSYQWSEVPGVLGDRELMITATALPHGRTGVLAQAQSDWVVPRPATEQIPSTTGVIGITSGIPRQTPSRSLFVANRAEVHKIVSVINALPIAQPIVYSCPLMVDPQLITMTFRAKVGGRVLALLTDLDFRPWSEPGGACDSVGLTIGGHVQDRLIGGDFLQIIGQILGRSLT